MCGLVGVMGNMFKKDIDAFNQLLLVDTLRGDHSTGVASITAKGEVELLKSVGPAWELQDRKSYERMVNPGSRCLIGHNRFGTMGARNSRNAHPFAFNNIVGAHNGTVDYQSKKRMFQEGLYETDSEAIFSNINEYGLDETIPLLEGAWALTFVDKAEGSLNMIRNKERPLHIAYNKKRDVMYWASELDMLKWVLGRNGIEAENFYYIPENSHYSWEITEGSKVIGGPRVVEGLEGKPRFQNYGWVNGAYTNREYETWSRSKDTESPFEAAKKEARKAADEELKKELAGFYNGDDIEAEEDDWFVWKKEESYEEYAQRCSFFLKSRGSGTTDQKTTPEVKGEEVDTTVVELFRYKHPNTRAFLSKAEFDEITQYGCDTCGKDITWGDQVRFAQVTDSPEVFCINCVINDQFTKDYIRAGG